MITGLAFLVVVATVPLFGGRLTRIAQLDPRHVWLLPGALAIQFAIMTLFADELPFAVAASLHVVSYGFALAFAACNRRIPGMVVLVVGGLLNLTAIVANDGVMPASAWALETAGYTPPADEFANSAPVPDANLLILGDIFAIPDPLPLANVFSIGDIVLVVGGGVFVHRVSGSSWRRRFPELALPG